MTDNRQITVENCVRDLLDIIVFWHKRSPSDAMLFCAQVALTHMEDVSIAKPLLGQLVDMLRESNES